MELLAKEYELTTRLVSMLKETAEKTQLNESWVFAALLEAGYKREPAGCIFCIESGRSTPSSLVQYKTCISKELEDKVKHVARIAHLNKDNGDLDTDEAAARLLILALTDRDCEFKNALNEHDVDQLYLTNPELGIKPHSK